MGYLDASIIVAISALLGAIGPVVVRRFVPLETLRGHHSVGNFVFQQMGVVFAVLLAFVLSEVWTEYNSAASAIRAESTSLISVAMLSQGLPPKEAQGVDDAIAEYLRTAARKEWPKMATEERSRSAEIALDRLWAVTRNAATSQANGALLGGEILARLADASKSRDERLFQMSNHVPTVLWVLLVAYAMLLAGFLLFFGLENLWLQAFFTAAFSGGLAFTLVVIAMLDFPFAGAIGLSAMPLENGLVRVLQDEKAPSNAKVMQDERAR